MSTEISHHLVRAGATIMASLGELGFETHRCPPFNRKTLRLQALLLFLFRQTAFSESDAYAPNFTP
ncbi:hypothetical protein WCLP8_3890004 [uncultured Gammaproteobacteria bacterium]